MNNPPLRLALLGTSPPLREGEDQSQAGRPSSPPATGGEVSPQSGDGEGAKLSRSRRKAGTTDRARAMRRDGTKAEALLWNELKARRLGGFHFVRQMPFGPYFADFACRKSRLVVEVDGSQHAESRRDLHRDAYFRNSGYSTLRFWNDDVSRQRTSVCDTILSALEGRLACDVKALDLRYIFATAHAANSNSEEPTL